MKWLTIDKLKNRFERILKISRLMYHNFNNVFGIIYIYIHIYKLGWKLVDLQLM